MRRYYLNRLGSWCYHIRPTAAICPARKSANGRWDRTASYREMVVNDIPPRTEGRQMIAIQNSDLNTGPECCRHVGYSQKDDLFCCPLISFSSCSLMIQAWSWSLEGTYRMLVVACL